MTWITHSLSELTQWRRSAKGKIGFVPTMGALHAGHASLLHQARTQCDLSVLSIFVNPTQFGPKEDFSEYPRTLEKDLQIAESEGVDVVFAPTPQEMYPTDYSTYVDETIVSHPLCGLFRPGHFRGVTTIVLKLFHLVQPHIAFFGLKDAQQFFVLSKMVQDLNLDIQVQGVPTVREPDGLALSSRNVYLSPKERKKAPRLYQTLQDLSEKIREGRDPLSELPLATKNLEAHGFQIQYLECLTLPQLTPLNPQHEKQARTPYLIAIAAYLGKTRLIDNVMDQSIGTEQE